MKKFLNNRVAVIWTVITAIVLTWFLYNALTGAKTDSGKSYYTNGK